MTPSVPVLAIAQEQRFAAALASLDLSPKRLRTLLEGRLPSEIWAALESSASEDIRGAAGIDRSSVNPETVERIERACLRDGVQPCYLGGPGYPTELEDDHEAPAVLFVSGDPGVLSGRPRVAVVGTRAATPYGLEVASEIGSQLARAGCVVISGLAQGIDSSAHAGALSAGADGGAPPVAVLGGPVNMRVGRARAVLRRSVAESGALLTEVPPGMRLAAWRFAVRNRIMAALSHVVVVVESHARGGSLLTADAAIARGRKVLAVPGSIRSPASQGTNSLLADGADPMRDFDDLLTAIHQAVIGDRSVRPPSPDHFGTPKKHSEPTGRPPTPLAERVLHAVSEYPSSLEDVVRRCDDMDVGSVSLGLEQLESVGLATERQGWWTRS